MKILAFLQNPWFKPDTDPLVIKKYRTDPDFHRRVLGLSATGRALWKAFGNELYHQIIWENANPLHGHTRDSRMPADPGYMATVVIRHQPDLVLCFGREARMGMNRIRIGNKPMPEVLYAPHPMAHGSANEHLEEIAREVIRRAGQVSRRSN